VKHLRRLEREVTAHSLAAAPLSCPRTIVDLSSDSRGRERWRTERCCARKHRCSPLMAWQTTRLLARVGVNPNSVRTWRQRFDEQGIDGIGRVAPGRGRKPSLPEGTVAEIVAKTMNEVPDDGTTCWSTRSLGAIVGVSHDTIARVWKDHGLRPWKTDAFKVSTDPDFEAKLVDVVGLYLNPPERAVVFSFDEKTQVQALDRTQPSLPMKEGRGATMTHDYKRHGTQPTCSPR